MSANDRIQCEFRAVCEELFAHLRFDEAQHVGRCCRRWLAMRASRDLAAMRRRA